MASRLAVLPVIATVFASIAVAALPSAAQGASADCTYTPVLPTRVAVDKAPKTFHTQVQIGGTVGGSACAKSFSAQEQLTHKSDTYTLAWQYNNRSSSDSVYPITVQPGTYRTPGGTNCVADTDADMTCAVEPGSTVIKYAGRVHLSAARLKGKDNDKVELTVRASRYVQYPPAKYLTTTVLIQRKDAGTWRTVHSGTARGKQGYVWTHSDSQSQTYRAVSAETTTAFGATSATVTR